MAKTIQALLKKTHLGKKHLTALRLEARTKQASSECVSLIIDYLRITKETMAIYWAVRLTDYLPSPMGARILIEVYDSRNPDLAYDIVEKLAKYDERGVTDLLIGALREKDPMVRASAAESLGLKKELAATKMLTGAMREDPHPTVRACAALALGEIGNRSVMPILSEALRSERRRMVRLRILTSLWILGDRTRFDSILTYLYDSNYANRAAAVNMLSYAKNGDVKQARKALIQTLRGEPTRLVRSTIRTVLSEFAHGR